MFLPVAEGYRVKFITLIPIERNDGSAVGQAEVQGILQRFWQVFPGATIEGPVSGHWQDAGQHYQDQCMRVTVSCDNELLDQARQIIRDIGVRLGQKAMYF